MSRTHNIQKILFYASVGMIAFFFMSLACALPSDNQQSVHIDAKSSQLNYKSGSNVYEGDVIVTQGTTKLTADRIITQNVHHKIDTATAYGLNKLAEYSTLPKEGDARFFARAKVITFNVSQSIITLEGNVTVTQGENSFHGPLIIYNMKDQTVIAPASKGGRATVVIEPNQPIS